MGELLEEKQKQPIKKTLKDDLVFQIRLHKETKK